MNLFEDPANPPSERTWLWVIYNLSCDVCWHAKHAEKAAETCLLCKPPQELTAA